MSLQGDLLAMYQQTRSWRKIGILLGVSGAYARMLATGERRVTPRIARAGVQVVGKTHNKPHTPRKRKPTKALRISPDVYAELALLKEAGETWDACLNRLIGESHD